MKPTKAQKIIEAVAELLAPKLLADGFTFDLKLGAFYRERNELRQYLFLKSHRLPLGLYRFTFNTGIRSDKVEKIFWKCERQMPFYENSCTLLQVCINVGPNHSPSFPVQGYWTIEDESHVSKIADEVKRFASGYTLPWFEKYNSLATILSALVGYPSAQRDDDTSKRYERALVLAAVLNDKQALSRLLDTVNAQSKNSPPSYLKLFEEFYNEVRLLYPEFLPAYSAADNSQIVESK